jgi:hypothetical protein
VRSLIRAGFLRPSAIRFHAGIFGRHTLGAVRAACAARLLMRRARYLPATAPQ